MNSTEILLLKKKLNEIKSYKGEGTQLISLYLPPNVDRSSVNKQLTDETSQSSNIKSQQTRKNVQAALKRLTTYLRQIDFKLPPTGLILFSGNVSENPAKTDVILEMVIPPTPLTTKLYWCDSQFHTDPLEDLLNVDEVYGLLVIDKREATLALLTGKSYKILNKETSGVPGKTRAGGQSSQRFSRLREKAAESFFKKVGELTNASFLNVEKLKGIIVGGPGMTKNSFLEIADIDNRLRDKILAILDTGYTDEYGIKELIDKSDEVLKETGIIKEKKLIEKYMGLVAKGGLAIYGFDDVFKALFNGQIEVLLLSEAIDKNILKFKCTNCNQINPFLFKKEVNIKDIENTKKCFVCNNSISFEEEINVFDFFVNTCIDNNTKLEIISQETGEGKQFLQSFGGIGAILRYKI